MMTRALAMRRNTTTSIEVYHVWMGMFLKSKLAAGIMVAYSTGSRIAFAFAKTSLWGMHMEKEFLSAIWSFGGCEHRSGNGMDINGGALLSVDIPLA